MFIILLRMNDGKLVTIQEDNSKVTEFKTYEEAHAFINRPQVRVFNWEIVEVTI